MYDEPITEDWLRSVGFNVRHLRTRGEAMALVEGLTGQPWNPELHLYGFAHHPKHAKQLQPTAWRAAVQ
jgi:hypothetical protein